MSTTINVTVDDGGLPAKNRQQTAANRQAFVQGKASQQAAQQGADQRAADRRAAGLDPATGRPLASAGASSRLPRITQEPAANRQGKAFIQFLPPTVLLPSSPLPPDAEPGFQALVRQWWSVKSSRIAQPIGLGDYASGAETESAKLPLFQSSDDFLTIPPDTINTDLIGNYTNTTAFANANTSMFSPRLTSVSEITFEGLIKIPPLGSTSVSTGTYGFSDIRVQLIGENPSFVLFIRVLLSGNFLAPINIGFYTGSSQPVQLTPQSLMPFKFTITENATSTLQIYDNVYQILNMPLWLPGQMFTVTCSILGGLQRDALSVPWPSRLASLGEIGGIKVAFKQ
jgi:hypothetical protein